MNFLLIWRNSQWLLFFLNFKRQIQDSVKTSANRRRTVDTQSQVPMSAPAMLSKSCSETEEREEITFCHGEEPPTFTSATLLLPLSLRSWTFYQSHTDSWLCAVLERLWVWRRIQTLVFVWFNRCCGLAFCLVWKPQKTNSWCELKPNFPEYLCDAIHCFYPKCALYV